MTRMAKSFGRFKPRMNYTMMDPAPVSAGVYSQRTPILESDVPCGIA